MPLVQTRGAASAQGFGEFAKSGPVNYIEDVFSTWLYTGNGSTGQTIANGIDLSTNGGMVWAKSRSNAQTGFIFDTSRGSGKYLIPSATNASANGTPNGVTFLTNGFSTVDGIAPTFANLCNQSGYTYASWTFRKQPKFFDVVTYTGNGSTSQSISHSLSSTPRFIVVKSTSTSATNWKVLAWDGTNYQLLYLNLTNAGANVGTLTSYVSSTSIDYGGISTNVESGFNTNGQTYVAYLFAHDAGGFGLTGTDNVISCGSYTGDGTTDGSYLVSLGYEPQWVLVKRTDSSTNGGWHMIDTMRGMPTATSASSITALLLANTSAAEVLDSTGGPKATGFSPVASLTNTNAATYIYIAIRRGPMKVPTLGTSVFNSLLITGNGANRTVTGVGFPADLFHSKARNIGFANSFYDRLRGATKELVPNSTAIENTDATSLTGFDVQDGVRLGTDSVGNATVNYPGGYDYVEHYFRRAPSFFDEVCYTGNNVSGRAITHNLAAVPELMIVKSRTSSTRDWIVYDATNGATKYMNLNNNSASGAGSFWVSTAPTSTVFTVSDSASVNDSAQNYVAYLFATCAGVSKVGSYTGNGTTQTINCGFGAGGARFVLIKRTDSTGDWYVYDTARGMTVLTDPYLFLNSVAAEVATLGSVTTVSTGFALNSTILAAINVSAGTYIFLAIA